MGELKFVRVETNKQFLFNDFSKSEEIINDMFKQGYSFKGYVPIREVGYGKTEEISLVFEKDGE